VQGEAATDHALITEAARGSREAFGAIYDRHAGAVATLARRVLGAGPEVDDLVHDVFLEAWARAGDFDPSRGSVRAWLLVRARSRCLDRKRSAVNARREPLSAEPRDPRNLPESMDAEVDSIRLRAALARLPVDQRVALVLGLFEGLSSSEIATRLDVPIGTVKSRVHAAMQKLRSELGDAAA